MIYADRDMLPSEWWAAFLTNLEDPYGWVFAHSVWRVAFFAIGPTREG